MNRIFLLFVLLNLFQHLSFSQNRKDIESLKNDLKKFDAHKRELGSKATPMMDTTKAVILMDLAKSYRYDLSDSALYYTEQSKALSEHLGYKKGIGNACNRLGLIYMYRGKNYSLALEYFNTALKIRTELKDKEGLGWTYNNMGLMYGGEGNYIESIKCHTNAIKYRSEIGDKEGMSESYRKRGREYFHLGNYPEALKDYLNSMKVAEESGFKQGVEASYRMIGELYEKEGNYPEALKNYIAASKVREKIGDKIGIASSYELLGQIYSHQGDTAEALKKYDDALKIYEEMKGVYGIAQINSDIGKINFLQRKYDAALNHFFVSLKIGEELKDKSLIANQHLDIAKVYEKKNDYQEAISNVKKALALALEIEYKDGIKEAYLNLSEIYAKLNDFSAAYKYHVLFQQLKDTLFNVEKTSKMKQLEMQYDFDKDAAIQKAQQEKKDTIQAKETENQKFKRNTVIIGLVVLVVFLIVLIILRNKIARERRQKALEQERSRISRDLHDDLGSGLISILMMSEQIQNPDNKELIGTNIEKIKQSSKLMVDQMRIIIWAMNSMNDTLENLLIYMETYAHDYFENLPVKLNIHLPEIIPSKNMTGMARRNIFLVVKESLTNINQHAHATEVNIDITSDADSMNIIITDNGKGFYVDETRRFGNGLKNMQSRMNDLKGSFRVESEIGKGTKTFINFPLG